MLTFFLSFLSDRTVLIPSNKSAEKIASAEKFIKRQKPPLISKEKLLEG